MPLYAYRVKHNTSSPDNREPVEDVISKYKSRPQSLTNLESDARGICRDKDYIYVIEVSGSKRVYRLGYYFQAEEYELGSWNGKRVRILSAKKPVGMYFDVPPIITGVADKWLRGSEQGMPPIPGNVVKQLDAMFKAGGKVF